MQIGKAITFATVQTMCNIDLDRYRDTWGCIIVDECHRVAGTPTAVTQFSKVLSSLAAKHKYGLSATVHRADGMIAATYALLGKIAYQVPEEAVADKIMTVSVLPRPTRVGLSKDFLDTDGTIIYAKMCIRDSSFKVMSGSSVSPFRYAIDTLKYSAIFNRVVLRGKEFSVHLLYALFDKPIASHTAAGEILRSLHNCSNLVLNILCSSVKASYIK